MDEPKQDNEAAGGRSNSTEVLAAKVDELTKKLAHLHCINGTLRADAERYSALRRGQKWSVIDGIGNTLRGDDLDAAIDKAMKAANII